MARATATPSPGDVPSWVPPMKAVAGSLPTDPGWAFEIKWDGMRIEALVGPGGVRLVTTNELDATERFPELAGLAGVLANHTAVLDGEVVAIGPDGLPSFSLLQRRMHRAGPDDVARASAEVPVFYHVFDLLELDGNPTVDLPYEDRRRLLEELIEAGPYWDVPATHRGDGEALLQAVTEQGLEGLMAKRLDSPYASGRRSSLWRKVKVRNNQEVVVGGWAEGEGSRKGRIGGLLVGTYEDSGLRYAGRVGSGLTEADLDELGRAFAELGTDECPFDPPPPGPVRRAAHWLEPVLVVQVAFGEWTPEGRLRHPSYLGVRIDKDATDVHRE